MKKGQILNLLVVIILAVGLTLWSLKGFSQNSSQSADEGAFVTTGTITWDQEFSVTEISSIKWPEGDGLILFPDTTVSLEYDAENVHLNVELSSGRLVYATLAGNLEITVSTSFASLESQHSMAYVDFSQPMSFLAYSIDHPNLLHFFFDGELQNSIFIPSENFIEVPITKVTPTLAKLRLTKLSKDFPSQDFKMTDLPQDVQDIFSQITATYAQVEVDFLSHLQAGSDFGPSLHGSSAWLNSLYEGFRSTFTILPHAKASYSESQAKDLTLIVESQLLYGNPEDATYWLDQWLSVTHSKEELIDLSQDLAFVLPQDALYPLKVAVLDQLYTEDQVMTMLILKFNDIESLLNKAAYTDAESAYDAFVTDFKMVLDSGYFDAEDQLDELSRIYLVLEELLRKNSIFYNTEDIALLYDLEQAILLHSGTEEDLNEARQAFIQSRLRFLSRLVDEVSSGQMDASQAEVLATDLLFEAEDYLNEITSDVAVSSYFEGKLKEYDLKIRYISSPEFYSYPSFDEGLVAFSSKQDELEELNDYLKGLNFGNQDPSAAVNEAAMLKQGEKDLKGAEIDFEELVPVGDSEHRLFEVKGASIDGYHFQANYDVETHIFYDVVISDLRFPSGLQLDSFKEVMMNVIENQGITKGETSSDPEADPENPSLEIDPAFEAAGFESGSLEVLEEDSVNQIYGFQLDLDAATVKGVYDGITQMVTKISLEYEGETYSVPNVELDRLKPSIEAMLDAIK